MRHGVRPLIVLGLAVLSAAVLEACGSSSSSSKSASSGGGKGYNQTDVAFAASMLPHHLGGVELGRLAVRKGVNAQSSPAAGAS